MNGLDRKNVVICKSLQKAIYRNKEIKCSDGDFKKQTEIKNDNLSLLAVKGFFHDCWQMKYKSPRVLFRAVATLK